MLPNRSPYPHANPLGLSPLRNGRAHTRLVVNEEIFDHGCESVGRGTARKLGGYDVAMNMKCTYLAGFEEQASQNIGGTVFHDIGD